MSHDNTPTGSQVNNLLNDIGDLKGLIGELRGTMTGLQASVTSLKERLDNDFEHHAGSEKELHERIRRHREDWERALENHEDESFNDRKGLMDRVAALERVTGDASASWRTIILICTTFGSVAGLVIGILGVVFK